MSGAANTILFDTVTHSPEETEALGARLAELLSAPDNINNSERSENNKKTDGGTALPRFVALYGDLGVGKTAFVRGFCSIASPGSAVRSPTFALVNEYRHGTRPVFHFDMYRITDDDELYSIGFYDYEARGGFCLAEWCENIPWAIPERHLRVDISKTANDGDRRVVATVCGRD